MPVAFPFLAFQKCLQPRNWLRVGIHRVRPALVWWCSANIWDPSSVAGYGD